MVDILAEGEIWLVVAQLESVRLPLLAAVAFEHCGNFPQLISPSHIHALSEIRLSLTVQLVTFLHLETTPAPVLLKQRETT